MVGHIETVSSASADTISSAVYVKEFVRTTIS